MNSEAQTDSDPSSAPDAPDHGVPPVLQGDNIVFDRRQDAPLLEKLSASRFTVLYGPPGVGKSFFLLNVLIPALEQQNTCVIYCQDWPSDDPTTVLKGQLEATAKKLEIPVPGAGRPSLIDLVRLLLLDGDRAVVLILDQFEQFFEVDHQDFLPRELG